MIQINKIKLNCVKVNVEGSSRGVERCMVCIDVQHVFMSACGCLCLWACVTFHSINSRPPVADPPITHVVSQQARLWPIRLLLCHLGWDFSETPHQHSHTHTHMDFITAHDFHIIYEEEFCVHVCIFWENKTQYLWSPLRFIGFFFILTLLPPTSNH